MQVCSNRLLHLLKLYRAPYSMIDKASAPQPQEPAGELRVEIEEMAKTVLLQGKQQCYLAVLPFAEELDFGRFGVLVGERVSPASEERTRDLFPDCELGALPPFGRLYGVTMYVDESLAESEDIVFTAGIHGTAMRMKFQDYRDLALPEIGSFVRKGEKQAGAPSARRVSA